ncbi:uncharacterized protein LOC116199255 isoform X1 [Punica granatum]|uniref:Uncharacterized protein LOC116199255 isoform X1 n=1 Tax=Punica granatum TaxID=22663 RepID=A0A6P8CTD3_PUNGR|nr:uncharacterized protein LOC116199255 isoform X1 [Punica granatum]
MEILTRLLDIAAAQGNVRLKLNQDKTELYFGGMNEERSMELLQLTGFRKGSSPIGYLGLPLTSERIQLIDSVLLRMASYWCANFILPKKVVQLVHQRCRAFL